MSLLTKQQSITELDAFCSTCPSPEEVTAQLAKLSFRLEFQMDEQRDHAFQLPPLPAQYHYKDASGNEALFLAGRDIPLDGERFPPHASRFWLYAGADMQAFTLAQTTMALQWQFTWRTPSEQAAEQEVA
jgi:hypothetical protein